MARPVGASTKPTPTGAIRELDIYAPDCPNKPPFRPSSSRFPRRAACAQPQDHRLVPGAARPCGGAERRRDGARLRRPPHDVRRALDRSGGRPERPQARTGAISAIRAPSTPRRPGWRDTRHLRSWLSQWSYDLSNAKGPDNAARIRRVPVLQIENQADDAVPATHNPTIRAALATADKEYVRIEGATHYYRPARQLQRMHRMPSDWSRRKRLLAD